MMKPKFGFAAALLVSAVVAPCGTAQNTAGPYEDLIPRHLLGLVHAPEVHAELELSADQISGLESLFRKTDARWFPARILPADKQLAELLALEQQVLDWFRRNTSATQQKRLRQVLYYAQGGRMLLRDDVAKQLGLQASQQEQLARAARETDQARKKLAQSQYGDPEIKTLQETLTKSMQAERASVSRVVRPQQRPKLQELLGDPFDPSKLNRIYAMAPEFVTVDHWVNSQPLTMGALRGKVVLVHFYAFQCHNCHANFGIYQRWHDELTEQGVVVVGIQTPETSRERDPNAVRSAAKERELEFPVLIDLESENWKAWGNTMWPTVYVVDKKGYIRHWWQGELNWKGATADKTIEGVVSELLKEPS
jgi:peroxiredoxin